MVGVNEIKIKCPKSPSFVAVALVAEFAKGQIPVHIEFGSNVLHLEITPKPVGDFQLSTVLCICRFLARVCSSANLYGKTVLEKTEIDHWLEFSNRKYSVSEFKENLQVLNKALGSITYLVGQELSIADICVWSMLYDTKQWHIMLADSKAPVNVVRWYRHLQNLDNFAIVPKMFPETVENNSSSKTEDVGKFVDLPGAKMGEVVVRFPPEASGFLHIGHAKAALLNAYYQNIFNGKLIMRFDDTNPEKEKEDFEKVILEDVAMLQIKPDIFTYTSDHFNLILEKCEELIQSGLAYVDDTDAETMKLERDKKEESKNRANDVQKNMSMWSEMKKGSEFGKQCCVRAKIDMQSDNGCLRDPTLYRCKTMAHPRTGNKFNVYPTYDFACPIVDSVEGVTHALRTTEYHDRDDQYFWFLEKLNLRKLHIYEYSRLNMTHTILSKRKLTWFVQQGIVSSWEDPRMPTVRGVLRRGMTVEGLKQFIVAQGSSRSVVVMEWDKIWAFNKKIIDPIAPRYNAVETDDRVQVLVQGAEIGSLEVAKHPKNGELGMKTITVGPKLFVDYADAEAMHVGENVTFINWGNLMIKSITKNSENKIEAVNAVLNLENKDYKKTLKVTWVCDDESTPLIPCACIYYDHLISKPILGKDDDFKDFLNDNTKIAVMMMGDSDLASLKKGDIIQIQRKGFFICDEPYDPSSLRYISRASPVILISIPDGSKDVSIFPKIVRSLRTGGESSKEALNRKKGKLAEKSPQEEAKQFSSPVSTSFDSSGFSDAEALNEQIKEQGDKIRILKSQNCSKDELKPEINILLKLKSDYKNATGTDWKPTGDEQTPKKGAHLKNKTAESPNMLSGNVNTQNTAEIEDLNNKIKEQGDKIRILKSENSNKDQLKPEIDALLKLKAEYKKLAGKEWKPGVEVKVVETKSDADTEKVTALDQKIKSQGEEIRRLKGEKASKETLIPHINALLKLKSEYSELTGKEWKPSVEVKKEDAKLDLPADADKVVMLDQQIKSQGDEIRRLKMEKASKETLTPHINALLKLKSEYSGLVGKEWKPGAEIKEADTKLDSAVDTEKVATLDQQIKSQGDEIRRLKGEKASKDTLAPHINALLKLKSEYNEFTGKEWKPTADQPKANSKKNESSKTEEQKVPNSNSVHKDKKLKTGNNLKPVENKDELDSSIKKITRLGLETKKEDNLADWYSQTITKAEMIEYYDVSGCYILRPWAYGIWESIVGFFDPAIKALGVSNSYFPMFVSPHALEKEKSHIEDFAPEVAWVTRSGNTELAEPIAIRPTSETVMYPSYAKWIRSHRDLPLKLNQWCSVVRWEFKHPQPFLRTREFLWQEGHTAFATRQEAVEEVYQILELYAQVYEYLMAIPVVRGQKTEKEKFAGADFTTTLEAYVSANGRAIQAATSHHLGQNFSKMFEIIFDDPETNEKCFAYQNSWGLTTRTIGVMVMVHGDNMGLVLPPRVAVHQIVIVPCGITANLSDTEKTSLIAKCNEFESNLKGAGMRVKGDYRDNYSPGWKYNHWELKGVPIRIELGPRDVKKNQFVAVRRDTGEKRVLDLTDGVNLVKQLLDEIHNSMYSKAKKEMDENMVVAITWEEFCSKLDQKCIIQAPFCGEIPCEDRIKKDSARNADELLEPGAPSMGAKGLCIPFQQPREITSDLKCIHPSCSNKPKYFTLFGRSY